MKYLFFDTETTGLPVDYKAPYIDSLNWPRIVQLSWLIADDNGNIEKELDHIVSVDFKIPSTASRIHGITNKISKEKGIPIIDILSLFLSDLGGVEKLVCHNVDFDLTMVKSELFRNNLTHDFDLPTFCTMKKSTLFCKLPGNRGYKWPRLEELYSICFNKKLKNAHNAIEDVRATYKIFYHLKNELIFSP